MFRTTKLTLLFALAIPSAWAGINSQPSPKPEGPIMREATCSAVSQDNMGPEIVDVFGSKDQNPFLILGDEAIHKLHYREFADRRARISLDGVFLHRLAESGHPFYSRTRLVFVGGTISAPAEGALVVALDNLNVESSTYRTALGNGENTIAFFRESGRLKVRVNTVIAYQFVRNPSPMAGVIDLTFDCEGQGFD